MQKEVTDEEMRIDKKLYYKRYRENNKDKIQEAQQRFWRKKVLENQKQKEMQ